MRDTLCYTLTETTAWLSFSGFCFFSPPTYVIKTRALQAHVCESPHHTQTHTCTLTHFFFLWFLCAKQLPWKGGGMFRECLVVVEFCFPKRDMFVFDYNKKAAGMIRLEYFQSHGLLSVCVSVCVCMCVTPSIQPNRHAFCYCHHLSSPTVTKYTILQYSVTPVEAPLAHKCKTRAAILQCAHQTPFYESAMT